MIKICNLFVAIFFLTPILCKAQKIYQFEKPGKWSISNRVDACEGKVDKPVFTKNLNSIGEWFHQNHPMLKTIKGFDLQLELENSCYSEDCKFRLPDLSHINLSLICRST